MAKQLQLRRGNLGENDLFLGVEGEPTYDITTHHMRIHDGVNLGGWILALIDDLPTKVSQLENDAGYLTESSAATHDWVTAYLSFTLQDYYTKSAIDTQLGTLETGIRTDMNAADNALDTAKINKTNITDSYSATDPDPTLGKMVLSAAGAKAIVDDLIAAIDAAD